jgi:hypothetical protein
MTHFEHQKTSKTALENQVKKGYARKNRGGFGGGLAWKDKIATWQCTPSAPSSHAARDDGAPGVHAPL